MLRLREFMAEMVDQDGKTLWQINQEGEVMLVFLRHFGCTFCREAMQELSRMKADIANRGVRLVLVHMAKDDLAFKYFQKYDLLDCHRISDPDCRFYQEFGLVKGTFNQLFGFRSWFRSIEAGLIKGHGFGAQLGDGFQMPGVFIISRGKIISEFRHKFASDKPDYLNMVECPANTKA
ncbi:MAG: AhpC/TSA family protein [Saprospiraceae bacterium]|jgi:peroxiredoxin|nr:AhpC/TSA family protein [Saprospiraceae bacterium]MBP9209689.1 AhpC/TSA family protein [Saprospiraceae bacterium]MBV6471950.1 hypothetical protein [Saprospiraceae bacterium]